MMYAQIVEECYFVFKANHCILSSRCGKDRVYFVHFPSLCLNPLNDGLFPPSSFFLCVCDFTVNSTSSKESSSCFMGQVESIFLLNHKKGNVLEKFAIYLYKP